MKGKRLIGIAIACTLLFSLLYVRSRFLMVELSYEASQQKQQKDQLEQQKRLLTVELASLKTPKRIEEYVQKHVGLSRQFVPKNIIVERVP